MRIILTQDRQRLPVVFDRVACMPERHATIYAVTLSRPASGSHSKVEQDLRGVAGLLSFLDARSIEFESRVADAQYLSVAEMDGLVLHFARPSRFNRSGKAADAPCGRTVALRMHAARKFLAFLISLYSHELWLMPEARAVGQAAMAVFLAELTERARVPTPRKEGRHALTAEQEAVLMSALVTRAQHAEESGDATSIFVADRELLWMDWMAELGLRTGEMLGIRLGDLDLQAGTCRIVRRRDAADDPRRDLARVKGDGRELDLSPYLAQRTREHVETLRAGVPGATDHSFLFVSKHGAPLSRSAVNKWFACLRSSHAALRSGCCSHMLRHGWHERFSEDALAAGLGTEEEMAVRAYAQGWRDEGSAKTYLAYRRRRQAAEISQRSQERQMAVRMATLS